METDPMEILKMNRHLIFLFVTGLCLSACSSNEFEIKESDVPSEVMTALKIKYPSAQIKKWEAEKQNGKFYFEAEIVDAGKEKDILVTADGTSVTEED